MKFECIYHLPAVTINADVEKLSVKSPQFILTDFNEKLQLPLGVPAMPIKDAIDLVKLADIPVNSSRFVPGAQVIGDLIDIAVITKHEVNGYKENIIMIKDLNLTITMEDE